eukprot:gnl/MRDRNA2_/MRDRNA2_167767_c0_seq1.p1 gnl/MRDRNA2_/MRDRNA2_167767_c0~~gnl/MRDRNA2_/MRDRNA2_167767_c0_seq1.p1  ORF type:complete len:186 (-),score=23.68 gnl/MRDRNA2_/MRDRNA2_167767_c0_seq1:147-704(-)
MCFSCRKKKREEDYAGGKTTSAVPAAPETAESQETASTSNPATMAVTEQANSATRRKPAFEKISVQVVTLSGESLLGPKDFPDYTFVSELKRQLPSDSEASGPIILILNESQLQNQDRLRSLQLDSLGSPVVLTMIRKPPCQDCRNTGKCSACGGFGSYRVGISPCEDRATCSICKGTGRCNSCS